MLSHHELSSLLRLADAARPLDAADAFHPVDPAHPANPDLAALQRYGLAEVRCDERRRPRFFLTRRGLALWRRLRAFEADVSIGKKSAAVFDHPCV